MTKRPAVFLDRDGTLIEDHNYLSDASSVRVIPGVPAALARLRAAGFACVVITNQSGIGRGLFTEAQYQSVHEAFARELAAGGATLDGVYHCPAAPAVPPAAEDPDRKPNPGMLLRAARELNLDLSKSYAVGDRLRDVVAGQRAGCRAGILVRTGQDAPIASEFLVVDSLSEAADLILSRLGAEAAQPL